MTEAEQLIEEYDGPLRPQVLELAENVVFMARKLKETRESMGRTPLIVKYDNGGGQAGYRENPVFKAYNSMASRYVAALHELESIVGAPVVVVGTDERPNRLADLRAKSRAQLKAV